MTLIQAIETASAFRKEQLVGPLAVEMREAMLKFVGSMDYDLLAQQAIDNAGNGDADEVRDAAKDVLESFPIEVTVGQD